MRLIQFIFRNLGLIGPRDKLVAVRRWVPAVYRYRGRWEVTWPAMLVDQINYRAGVAPVWDWTRIKPLLLGER